MNSVKEKLRSLLKKESFPEKVVAVYLYGSAAKNALRVDSDVDIAILPLFDTSDDESLQLICQVEAIITKSLKQIGIKNDVSIFNMRGKYASILLLFSIISEGVLVYEKRAFRVYRREFENMIIREYHDFAPYFKRSVEERYTCA